MQLYEALSEHVTEWSKRAYPHAEYSTISEILSWAANPDGEGFQLRTPQLRALETYWYLRLVEGTPRVFDLYNRLFEDDKSNLLGALGVPDEAFKQSNFKVQNLWEKIR
ncbi:MAG: restriction endonuclease subunit R, partial [Pyrinomonadaceae bacterium]|nr:restriction endonuclease subunit R [Pyrinomonadaceae bacterium]